MSAATQAEWLFRDCKEATNNQLSRLDCLATDTWATMKALWVELEKIPEMKHVFMVPCDSLGLQLLIEDILNRPYFETILHEA